MADKPTYEELEQKVKVLKENELKLRVSEQELNSILHHLPDIIYRLNPEGEITYINDIVKEYGYSREELIGKNILEFVHPDDREKAVHRIDERRTGDRSTKSYEIRLLRKDLDYVPFENKSRGFGDFLIDAEGIYRSGKPEMSSFVGTQGIARDIFERKQVEDALRKSEEKYRSLITNIPDVTWTTDYEGKTSFISPNIEKEFGYTPEEISKGGDSIWLGRIHPEDAGKVKKAFREIFEEGIMLDVEYRIKRKDGEWIWLHDRSIAIYERDGVMYADGIFTNITEAKRMAEVLQRSEEHRRSFMESAKGFIVYRVEVDPENYSSGHLVFVSPGIEDEIGISPEAEFSEWFKNVHPDDLPALVEAQSKSVQNGDTFDQEFRWKNKKGGWGWGHAISNPVFDSKDNPKYFNGMIIDVTGQKQAEKALQESEGHLRSLMESASNFAVYRLISDGDNPNLLRVIFVSPSITDIMGVSEPMSFETWFKHIHLDDVERIVEANIEAFKTLRFDETMRVYHPQKQKWVWIHAISTGFEDQERQRKYVNGILIDVTREKETEEALRETEKRFRYLSDASMEAIFFTQQGICLEANQIAAKMFGYDDRSEFIGMFGTEIIAPESHEIVKENVLKNLFEPYEAVGECKDGTRFPIAIRAKEMPYKDKGMVRATSIMDITDRKRAEEALKTAETTYRNIFRNSQIGLFRTDMNTGLLLDANDAVAQFIGYKDRNDLLSKPFSIAERYVDPKDREDIVSLLKANGEFRNYEARYRRNDGTIIWMRFSARVVPEKGWMEGVSEDITDQKLAETSRLKAEREKEMLQAQLHRSQKMEVLGTLAGSVAHDLNNILGGLVGYPELLLLQLPENSPLKKSILTIQKSGEKAAAVVQDLLTLARRGVVVTDVVNLNAVIAEYLKSPELENLKSYHPGVHIETRLEKDVLNILGSSTHLSKTVMNLTSNAAEAMPEGGKISISTENRYIDRPIGGYDNVKEGDYVVLIISDTGTGISPDDMEKIFEPFYTKKKMGRSGTGLGMAVVWGTVKDHNGYIDAQSAEGKGTTFTLHFPVTRKSIEERSEISPKDYMGKGETILVVDDVEEQRQIASGMLIALGYSVESVSSGEEAVEYLKSNKADLLVLDMIMDPGMDGLDTYRKILEMHSEQKAIIASGFSETNRAKKLQHLGARAYIRKPFLLEKIGIAVKEELEK